MSDTDAPPPEAGPPERRRSWSPLSLVWNREQRRLPALWRIAALVVTVSALGRLVEATGLRPELEGLPALLSRTLLNAGIAVVGVWLVGRLLDRRRLREFGLQLGSGWLLDFAFGAALGALLMAAIFLTEWSLGWIRVVGTLRTATPGSPFALELAEVSLLFLGVAILEELLARGYLLRALAEGMAVPRLGGARGSLILACLLSSGLFALGHVGNPNATWVSTFNIALAGILLALGYLLTAQLAIPIGLHLTWNLFQASVFGFPVSGVTAIRTSAVAIEQAGPDVWTGGAFGPEAGLLALGAMAAGAASIALWVRWRRGRVALAVELVEPPAGRAQVAPAE